MQEGFEKIIEKLEEYEYENLVEHDSEQSQHCKDIGDCEMRDCVLCVFDKAIEIVKQEAEQYNNGWIPFVQREMTEDEKESFGDLNFMLDCQLPDENEEILITYKFKDELYVDVDTFMRDGSECYLDSGRDFVTEAVAWMKKPHPYQPKGE